MSDLADARLETSPARAAFRRSAVGHGALQVVLPLLFAAAVLGGWEALVRAYAVPEVVLPAPSAVAAAPLDEMAERERVGRAIFSELWTRDPDRFGPSYDHDREAMEAAADRVLALVPAPSGLAEAARAANDALEVFANRADAPGAPSAGSRRSASASRSGGARPWR